MGKRKRILLGVIACFITSWSIHTGVGAVKADIVWTPVERFVDAHFDELERDHNVWIANSKKGYVTLYKSPESKRVVTYIENGAEEDFECIYTDSKGVRWGLIGYADGMFERLKDSGWAKLDEFVMQYDTYDFMNENDEDLVFKKVDFDPTEYRKSVIL